MALEATEKRILHAFGSDTHRLLQASFHRREGAFAWPILYFWEAYDFADPRRSDLDGCVESGVFAVSRWLRRKLVCSYVRNEQHVDEASTGNATAIASHNTWGERYRRCVPL